MVGTPAKKRHSVPLHDLEGILGREAGEQCQGGGNGDGGILDARLSERVEEREDSQGHVALVDWNQAGHHESRIHQQVRVGELRPLGLAGGPRGVEDRPRCRLHRSDAPLEIGGAEARSGRCPVLSPSVQTTGTPAPRAPLLAGSWKKVCAIRRLESESSMW